MRSLVFEAVPEEDQDVILADFALDARDDDWPLHEVRCAISAAQKLYPRRKYTTAWKVVAGWQRDHPPEQAPPMPQDVAMAAAVLLTAAGRMAEATIVLLCFCGLLRVGEALQLERESLIFGPRSLVLLLRRTKTGEHQRVELTNPQVVLYVHKLLTFNHHPRKVCPTSYGTFRLWLAKVLVVLGCGAVKFRSHSLRRGGATTLFMQGQSLAHVMCFGRRASESSCRIYIRSGEAAVIRIRRGLGKEAQVVAMLASLGGQVFSILGDLTLKT